MNSSVNWPLYLYNKKLFATEDSLLERRQHLSSRPRRSASPSHQRTQSLVTWHAHYQGFNFFYRPVYTYLDHLRRRPIYFYSVTTAWWLNWKDWSVLVVVVVVQKASCWGRWRCCQMARLLNVIVVSGVTWCRAVHEQLMPPCSLTWWPATMLLNKCACVVAASEAEATPEWWQQWSSTQLAWLYLIYLSWNTTTAIVCSACVVVYCMHQLHITLFQSTPVVTKRLY